MTDSLTDKMIEVTAVSDAFRRDDIQAEFLWCEL